MKAKLYINMYSGTKPPEVELTEEQSQKIIDLSSNLHQPYTAPHYSCLGNNHYAVFWSDGSEEYGLPVSALRAEPGGYVHIWKSNGDTGIDVIDSSGLWEYLNTIGGPLLHRHLEECRRGMEEYQAGLTANLKLSGP